MTLLKSILNQKVIFFSDINKEKPAMLDAELEFQTTEVHKPSKTNENDKGMFYRILKNSW